YTWGMSLLTTLVLALACGAADPQPATQPATRPASQQSGPLERGEPLLHEQPATPEAVRAEAKREIEAILQRLPNAEPGRLGDLIATRFIEGFLVVELKAEPEEWPLVMPVEGADG